RTAPRRGGREFRGTELARRPGGRLAKRLLGAHRPTGGRGPAAGPAGRDRGAHPPPQPPQPRPAARHRTAVRAGQLVARTDRWSVLASADRRGAEPVGARRTAPPA